MAGGWSCGRQWQEVVGSALKVESQIHKANVLLARTPSVHSPVQSHKQRGKAQRGEKEEKSQATGVQLNLSSQRWPPPALATAAPASPAHVAPRNATEAPRRPRSRPANCPPLPASMRLRNTPGRDNRLHPVGCFSCLSPLSLASPFDKRWWWWASLGGSHLSQDSSFRNKTCLKK